MMKHIKVPLASSYLDRCWCYQQLTLDFS